MEKPDSIQLDHHDWLEIYMFLGLSRLKLRNMMAIFKTKLTKVIIYLRLINFLSRSFFQRTQTQPQTQPQTDRHS
jgi:hypothetical protein